jgi:excisionase family DNA binding protein
MNHRTSNPKRSLTSPTGTPGRPVTKLRKTDEAAEVFNGSPRTLRRLIDSGALPVHRLPGRRHHGSGIPKFYDIKAVAESLDVSQRTIRRWVARGDLIVHRRGRERPNPRTHQQEAPCVRYREK